MIGNRTKKTLLAVALVALPALAPAQIRVVSYNTLDKPVSSTDESQFDTIFSAIAATDRNGIAKRVDVLSLQEQRRQLVGGQVLDTSENIATRLNATHGVTSYESRIIGAGTDRISIVFDNSTVELLGYANVGTEPRPTPRAWFRPVGYRSPDADFFVYGMHLKAGSSASDISRRLTATNAILNNAEATVAALGGGEANFMYVGDSNFGGSSESGYQAFTAHGSAQALDPIDLPFWPSAAFAEHMTQSTRTTGNGGAGGGLDDRFDLQVVTADLLDGEGLSYLGPTSTGLSSLEHSHQAFGNDGNTYNTRINATFVGRSQSAAVINALHDFSDHLPVVADYQLPAVLGVEVDPVPMILALGEAFSLEVAVANAAGVVAAAGADELDYLLSTSGDLSGAFSGTLEALAADALHEVLFDTSTLGLRSGVLTVSTSSEAAANALFELPISYEVVSPLLAGDYNDDGLVDAADYTAWRDGATLLNETVTPGLVTEEDYTVWRDNYGAASLSLVAVPEATAVWLLGVLGVGILAKRR